MANEKKVIIPAKVYEHLKPGQRPVVKISPKAYDILVDLTNQTGRPLNRVASAIIEQAFDKNLIELEKCYEAKDGEA